ncbi:MAG: hypothetical protein J5I41_12465 [Saprospiraceae bacterium]|nr:hypothetical protein [Saprospiraceae bacterium]
MDAKLEALTRKLLDEGVQKAEAEARKILDNAQKEAEDLRKKAESQSVDILARAQDESMALQRRARSEIQMMVRQSRQQLRQELENLLSGRIVQQPVRETLGNADWIAGFMTDLIRHLQWDPKGKLVIAIPEQTSEAWRKQVRESLTKALDQAPVLKPTPGLTAGFQIGKEGEHYRISFSEADFSAYLKQFLTAEFQELIDGEA